MHADISDFERLQTNAVAPPTAADAVWHDEGTKLIRLPVQWNVTEDGGRFHVFETEGIDTTANWQSSHLTLDDAKLSIQQRKIRLTQ